MIIKQIYNNNVILSENEAGDEIILVGRGIAFGMSRGSKVVEGRIEKKFELQDDVGQKFKKLAQEVPYKTIMVSEEIIDYIKTQSNKRINDSIYVTLTDHIANMIERIKMGIVFDTTLLLNVKSLYKEEYRLGLKVTELLRQKLKIQIDDGEASFIALHIINAELDSNMQQMYEITAVIDEILNIVREDFQLEPENGQCDRFITHCRFFAQRVVNNEYLSTKSDMNLSTYRVFEDTHPRETACIERIAQRIQERYHYEVSTDENCTL
ncbi:MAG: PRD domain-containing protein [Holdemania massiliensis]